MQFRRVPLYAKAGSQLFEADVFGIEAQKRALSIQ